MFNTIDPKSLPLIFIIKIYTYLHLDSGIRPAGYRNLEKWPDIDFASVTGGHIPGSKRNVITWLQKDF